MSRILLSLALLSLLSGMVSVTAAANSNEVHYAWANVTRVNPVYQRQRTSASADGCVRATAQSATDPPPCTHGQRNGTLQRSLVGYQVAYRYQGQVYVTRMDYDPGERLRVRVTVRPAD